MKKFYVMTLCALLGASSAVAGGRFESRRNAPSKKLVRAEAAVPVWRPAKAVTEMFMEGEWIDPVTYNYQYDSRGNVTVIDSSSDFEKVRDVRTYDEWDQLTSSLVTVDNGSGEWANESRTDFVYDPVVHTFFTLRNGFQWEENAWVKNYKCEANTVTRNESGNIIEIVKSVPLFDFENLQGAYKSEWNYDEATGKANEFRYYENYGTDPAAPAWTLYRNTSYRNIVWAETDGQMTGSDMTEFAQGANRIASADVFYGDEADGHLFVTYTDRAGEFTMKQTYMDPNEVGEETKFEYIDANGSFRVTESEFFDEDGAYTGLLTYQSVVENMVDEHGNVVLQNMYERYSADEELMLMDSYKIDYAYDAQGNATEMTSYLLDPEVEDEIAYVPETHTVYSDYVDVAGIDSIIADKASSFDVYNLQGIRVMENATEADLRNLPAGLYIGAGRKFAVK